MTTSTPAPRKSYRDMLADNTPSFAQVRTAAADYVPVAAAIASTIASIAIAASASTFPMSLLMFVCWGSLLSLLCVLLYVICNSWVRPPNK